MCIMQNHAGSTFTLFEWSPPTDILSGIFSDIPFGRRFDIPSGILSGICSGIYLAWCLASIPAFLMASIVTSITLRFRSSVHCIRYSGVQASRHAPLHPWIRWCPQSRWDGRGGNEQEKSEEEKRKEEEESCTFAKIYKPWAGRRAMGNHENKDCEGNTLEPESRNTRLFVRSTTCRSSKLAGASTSSLPLSKFWVSLRSVSASSSPWNQWRCTSTRYRWCPARRPGKQPKAPNLLVLNLSRPMSSQGWTNAWNRLVQAVGVRAGSLSKNKCCQRPASLLLTPGPCARAKPKHSQNLPRGARLPMFVPSPTISVVNTHNAQSVDNSKQWTTLPFQGPIILSQPARLHAETKSFVLLRAAEDTPEPPKAHWCPELHVAQTT